MTIDHSGLTKPLRRVTYFLGWPTIVILAAGTVLAAAGSGSIFGFGQSQICATRPRSSYSESNWTNYLGIRVRPSATITINGTLQACTAHPSFGQRVLFTLTEVPEALLWGLVLLLLWQLLRTADRDGPFTAPVATAMRRLGWLILIGSLVVASVQGTALDALLRTVLYNAGGYGDAVPDFTSVLPVPLLAWAALLSFGRIIRVGVKMDEEIRATV